MFILQLEFKLSCVNIEPLHVISFNREGVILPTEIDYGYGMDK